MVPNASSIFNYAKLYQAIPEGWESSNSPSTSFNFLHTIKDKMLDSWSSSKRVYLFLLEQHEGPLKHQLRWANDFGIENTSINWKAIYCNNYFCTLETKLRSFQTKLNHRAVVTNLQLHGFGLSESELCCFCKFAAETTLHLFCFCPIVQQFWEDVSAWLSFYFKTNIVLPHWNKLFGAKFFKNGIKTKLLNCFLLNARFLIFKHKCNNTFPTLYFLLLLEL